MLLVTIHPAKTNLSYLYNMYNKIDSLIVYNLYCIINHAI